MTKNESVKELAYKTHVRPQLEYSSWIWSPHTQAKIIKLEMVQRRAARWVKNDYSRNKSVTHLQNALGWQTLDKKRRLESNFIMFYKMYSPIVLINLPLYLQPQDRFTRNMHPLESKANSCENRLF